MLHRIQLIYFGWPNFFPSHDYVYADGYDQGDFDKDHKFTTTIKDLKPLTTMIPNTTMTQIAWFYAENFKRNLYKHDFIEIKRIWIR
jgi:hypothetical protein